MNTYRVIDINNFPTLNLGQVMHSSLALTIPGFTENTVTTLKLISERYYGFEYYEFYHEILIRDSGVAYGFYEGKPIKLDFQGFKKGYTVKAYLNRESNFLLLSQSSIVVEDLLKKLKADREMQCDLSVIQIDLKDAAKYVPQFKGAWFKSVSSRVSSSALFGADLKNDPIFEQLQNEGASLTSITIPFGSITIQLNAESGISSHTRINNIENESIAS
jgi:hypothetical protein